MAPRKKPGRKPKAKPAKVEKTPEVEIPAEPIVVEPEVLVEVVADLPPEPDVADVVAVEVVPESTPEPTQEPVAEKSVKIQGIYKCPACLNKWFDVDPKKCPSCGGRNIKVV
jgi:hypothetical protein